MNDDNYSEALKFRIEELRRVDDQLNATFDQLRFKSLAMIAGELALSPFIFSTDRLHIPHEYYGCIFFFLGILFYVVSFGLLLWTIAATDWTTPGDGRSSGEIKVDYPTLLKYLEWIVEDYLKVIGNNSPLVGKRARRFNWSLYLLAVGGIMLLVIKFGGA